MKRVYKGYWPGLILLLLIMLVAGGVVAANGGVTIDWYSVDSGGGQSDGGDYQLDGIIGQPEAQTSATGGDYQLDGGYLAGTTAAEYTIYLPLVIRP